jgi:cytochrome c oxidase assembly protein subunit 15
MKSFRRIAFLSTIATYLLIFVGGLVRVSGAGLGCPDWPKCFGRWFPPTNISQLPANMDPSMFNFVLAWIEYFNRLVGAMVGILIFVTAVLAIVYYRKRPKIVYPSLAALILVMYQAWQGGQVVTSHLEPFLISIHLLTALLITGLLIYVTLQSYYTENPQAEQEAVYPRTVNLWIGLLGIAVIVQIALGTRVRALFEILADKFPLLAPSSLVGHVGATGFFHALLGLLVGGLTLHFGLKILRHSRSATGMVREGIWVMMLLASAQIAIGLILFMAGLPALMELFHLWIASLYFGTILVLYLAFRKNLGGVHGK